MDRVGYNAEIKTATFTYRFFRGLFTFIFRHFCRWQVAGLENVPATGPVVVAVNHTSNWDPVIVGCAINRQIHFMAKKELFGIPVVGWICQALAAYPVERGKTGRQALRASLDILAADKCIGMFPEGTRSKTGEISEAKGGVVMIAAKAQTVIIPVGLYNSRQVFFRGRFRPFAVCFGPPVSVQVPEGEKLTSKRLQSLANELMVKIAAEVEKGRRLITPQI
ncbi:MAG: lysophospholipid acyltransferase family protein [Heliobacteriaceae bacterium]|nr:lysophospholipid acyltransferase family protein [Heliobacteriaceae bacterium]MDD4587377.1 lysophospholipid acyltransferase family protein [Heliobacteriaceae bacterium]